jgi:anti-sigma-K factor RskA
MIERLPDDQELLAAELALGLLEGKERAAALRLSLSDPAFAGAVTGWTERLAPLFDEVSESLPPAYVWPAIEARIGARDRDDTVQRLRTWRATAIAATAVAASLAAMLVIDWRGQAPEAPIYVPEQITVAQLVDPSGSPLATAAFDPRTNILKVRSGQVVAAPLAPELWVIPADGVPRSLGLIMPRGISEVAIAPALRGYIQAGATLAITGEQRETAPHAAPGSTPVAVGKISLI